MSSAGFIKKHACIVTVAWHQEGLVCCQQDNCVVTPVYDYKGLLLAVDTSDVQHLGRIAGGASAHMF